MKKRIIAIVLSVLLIVSVFPFSLFTVSAAKYGNFTYTISNGEVTINSYSNYDENASREVIVPDTIQGFPVTKIGKYAFGNEDSISPTSIVIPDSVQSIGDYAFYYSYALTSISFGSGLKTIGYGALSSCGRLEKVYIKDLVSWCNITFSEEIPDYNLYINGNLASEISIPDGVTSINDYAFASCNSIREVIIPEGVRTIGYYAFAGCSSLNKVIIPKSVRAIDFCAFASCKSLSNVNIPEGVTTIADCAFYNCVSLSNITIPESVTDIPGSAFSDCDALIVNVYKNSAAYYSLIEWNIPINVIGFATSGKYNDLEWKYEQDCKKLYLDGNGTLTIKISSEKDTPWYGYIDEIHNICIGDGITEIGNSIFSKMSALKKVELSESVEKIGSSAFADCRNLEEINLNSIIKEIPEKAFYNCLSLKNIGDTSGILSVGDNAFYRCMALEEVELENTTYIGNFSFYKCTVLNSVRLTEKIKNIGECAFGKCTALKRIYIPENINALDPDAFVDCNVVITHNPNFVDGDIDGDGIVSATDITAVRQALCNNAECDINGDGKTNLKDLVCIKKMAVNE